METVSYGSEGETVAIFQQALNETPYDDVWAGEVDGIFGDQTQVALVNFQINCGIEADGIAGLTTWYYLGYEQEAC
ncbi:MAG: peptidoglycan-binding protein [Microcoleaceae cyanobacterium MO_207.B10]|nr:peptidoglycan-binding protein [Microcoleaceae cyanobacterium MO_207.B10]